MRLTKLVMRRMLYLEPFLGESVQDAVISKTPDGVRVTVLSAIVACAFGNIAIDKRRQMKNARISRPGHRPIRCDCDLCECGLPLTSTRETCILGTRMRSSVSILKHVLGDWHTCARFKMFKLGICVRHLVQLLEFGLLRRPTCRASGPSTAGLCSRGPLHAPSAQQHPSSLFRGGPLPAPSAHEHPSSLFRTPLSSHDRLRRLLSRDSARTGP